VSLQSLTTRFVDVVKGDGGRTVWKLTQQQTDLMRVVGRHTGAEIANVMEQLCLTWKLGMDPACKIVLTADRGTNVISAVRQSGQFLFVPCFQHVMHRAILSALDAVKQ
jgi:hypothetical protein